MEKQMYHFFSEHGVYTEHWTQPSCLNDLLPEQRDFVNKLRRANKYEPFYPHDAMLARVLSYGPVSVRLCLSVCHMSEFCRNGWTHRAGLGMAASFGLSYTVCKEIRVH